MVRRKHVVAAILIVIAAAAAAPFLFKSEESRIRIQFDGLSSALAKTGDENLLSTAAKSKEAANYFAATCAIQAPYQELSGTLAKQDIAATIAQIRTQCGELSVKFSDLKIEPVQGTTAKASLTIRVHAVIRGDRMSDVREFESTLSKIDGKWLFTSFTVVEVMKK